MLDAYNTSGTSPGTNPKRKKSKELQYPIPLDFVWTVEMLANHVHVGKNSILNLIYTKKLKAFSVSVDIRGKHTWRIYHREWLKYVNGTP